MTKRAFPPFILFCVFAAVARAQFAWSPSAPTGAFNTASNWSGNLVPASSGVTTSLTFSGWSAATPIITFANSFQANSLTFNGSSVNYQLAGVGGAVLGLGSGGITANGGATITLLSSLPIQLLANQTWQATNATDLLAQGVISGAFKITKTGNFGLTLSAANTFSGGFSLNDGELYLGTSSTGTPGAVTSGPVGTGTLTFGTSQTLGVNGAATTLHNNISLGSTNPTFATGANNLTLAGTISGTGSITKTGSGPLTLSGANTFSGETNIQAGTLVLGSSSNKPSTITDGPVGTYELNLSSGTTLAIADGSIRILHNDLHFLGTGTVTVDTGTGDLTLASDIHPSSGGDTASLTKTGSGSLTLTNNANSYKGGTIINAGTLIAGSDGVFGILAGGITFGGGTSTLKASASFASARTITLNAGGGTIDTATFPLTLSGVISGAGGLTKQGTGTLTLSGANTFTNGTTISAGTLSIGAGGTTGAVAGNIINAGTLVFNRSNASTYAGVISGAGNLTKLGAGKLTFTGVSTYTGATNLSAGILEILTNNALPTTTALTLSGSATFDVDANQTVASLTSASSTTNVAIASTKTFTVAGTASTTYAGILSDAGILAKTGTGTLTLTGANTYTGGTTISGGTLAIGDGGPSGSIAGNITNNASLVFNRSNALTYTAAIAGTGSLTKSSAGTLSLTGASTYTGTTTVSGGTLRVGVANALPATTQLSLGAGSILDVDFNQTVAGFLTPGSGSFLDLASGITFTVAMPAPNTTTTYAGNVIGSGVFAVSGAGGNTVNLTGSVPATVPTFVGTGVTLVIGSGGSLFGPVSSTGTLRFENLGSQTLSEVISGTGSLTISAGTTTLTGNNTLSGPTTINNGKLIVNGVNAGGGSITIGFGGVLGGSGSFSGPVFVNSGGSISPGNSPGILNVGPTTFAGGGSFAFEMNSVAGTPGTQWDLMSVSGALTITATAGSPFTINLTSLTLGNAAGIVSNFVNTNSYLSTWKFVETSGGVTGFTANAFQFDTTNFLNPLGTGSFFVSNIGNDLFVNFAPVPEPSTYVLMALGLGLIVILARRRRR